MDLEQNIRLLINRASEGEYWDFKQQCGFNQRYYLLEDYEKSDGTGKNRTIVRAGIIYSRVRDRNTSSSECAAKESVEFLWKKRFGLVGTDEFKVIKRLQNIDN